MLKPVKVKALSGYRLWIEYDDGVRGEVDLSDMAGKGVFEAWDEKGFFEKVHIEPIEEENAVVWDDIVEVDPYNLYMKITGKAWEELPIEVQMTSGAPLDPVEVKALPGYRIWIAYEDGECGELDLSHLVGKGMFKAWDTPGIFEKVHVSTHRSIAWNDELEICPDALYMDLTGIRWEALYIDITGKSREELTRLANLKFDHA